MRPTRLPAIASLSSLVALATAADIVYVTDLAIFTYLAPCAASAVSYNVQQLTEEQCASGVTELQSCVCTKNNNLAAVSSSISDSVSWSCGGSTATDDQASAATVLSAYCNQDSQFVFPTPTSPVFQYITDVPEISYLAPCAQEQVSYAVMGMTDELCPPEAPDLATCVCSKNQNSLMVSQTINSSVRWACSSHTADISSAQAFFAAYCAMNAGTTSFPTPTPPAGDMTYYITDLPQFSSLPPCAQVALSDGVFTNTNDMCPGGPQYLASCACLKDGMSPYVSSVITSSIKWECTSTDTEDISSALGVFDFYCSAARNEVTPGGVTRSVAQTLAPTQAAGTTGPKATSGSGSGNGNGNGSGSGSGGNSSGSGSGNSGSNGSSSGGAKTAIIAGAAVAVVAGLAIIGVAIFFIMRHARQNRPPKPQDIQLLSNQPPDDFGGKQELGGTPIDPPTAGPGAVAAAAVAGAKPLSPSPSVQKHGRSPIVNSVSPVSVHSHVYPPPAGTPELQGRDARPPMPPLNSSAFANASQSPNPNMNRPELQGQMYNANGPLPANHAELQGQMYNASGVAAAAANRPELQGQMYSPNGAISPNRPELPGQVYNANGRRPAHAQELQGQMYNANGAAPANRQELYGQPVAYGGSNNGQHLPQQQQQQQQPQGSPYGQPFQGGYPAHQQQYQPQTYQQQQQQAYAQGMSWQSGPVQPYSPPAAELEADYASQQLHAR